MKKYDNYKDSGIDWIGEIPEHWEISRLRNIAQSIKTGSTPPSDEVQYFEPHDLNWYGPGDFDNLVLLDAKRKISDLAIEENKCRLFPSNSILLIGIGATVGKVGIVSKASASNQQINAILLKDEFNPKYYTYFISTIKDVIVMEASSATLPIFNQTQTKNIVLPVPQIIEQIQIANFLDHKTTQIETLITKKKQFITLLQEERIAVINQVVTKGLDPKVKMKDSGIEWLGEIPEHWEVKKLKLIFNPSKGLTITKENLKDEGIQCVNYGEVHSKFGFELDTNIHKLRYVDLSYLESNQRSLIECGDFVFADTSEDIAGAGNFTYLKSEDKIFAGYHTIILKPSEILDSRFFAYEFDSIPFRTQIRQSVKGVKVFSITQTILKNVNTWFPPKNEQKAISDFLTIETDKIDSIILKAKEEIELLKEYKTALISEAVTGKVDVRDVVLN